MQPLVISSRVVTKINADFKSSIHVDQISSGTKDIGKNEKNWYLSILVLLQLGHSKGSGKKLYDPVKKKKLLIFENTQKKMRTLTAWNYAIVSNAPISKTRTKMQ